MTRLFTVGAKLLGVYFVYHALIYLINAVVFTDGLGEALLVQLLLAVVTGVIAILLMFRTESVGRVLDVGAAHDSPGRFESPAEVMQVGVVLIGIFVFLTRLASLLQMISARVAGVRFDGLGGAGLRIAIESVPILLSVYAILRADRIVGHISPTKPPATR